MELREEPVGEGGSCRGPTRARQPRLHSAKTARAARAQCQAAAAALRPTSGTRGTR